MLGTQAQPSPEGLVSTGCQKSRFLVIPEHEEENDPGRSRACIHWQERRGGQDATSYFLVTASPGGGSGKVRSGKGEPGQTGFLLRHEHTLSTVSKHSTPHGAPCSALLTRDKCERGVSVGATPDLGDSKSSPGRQCGPAVRDLKH